VSIFGAIIASTRETGDKIKCMEKENLLGLMGRSTLVHINFES
jgi:hypothetical protein